jgi:hypothetical protein
MLDGESNVPSSILGIRLGCSLPIDFVNILDKRFSCNEVFMVK